MKTITTKTYTLLLFAILILVFSSESSKAATITVNSILDPDNTTGSCTTGGSCSLRQAVNAAASFGDTVLFNIPAANCPGNVCTIDLQLNGIQINRKNLSIVGNGARNLIIRRAAGTFPGQFTMFVLTAALQETIDISITGLSVVNGTSMTGGGGIATIGNVNLSLDGVSVNSCSAFSGGGLYLSGGNVRILNSTIANNGGGGIYNEGSNLTMANTTISGNSSSSNSSAGGIQNGGTLNMNNVTITGNIDSNSNGNESAGGVANTGTVNSRNTIIGGNFSDNGRDDVLGTFISQGTNLIGRASGSVGFSNFTNDIFGQPVLGSLTNNGGQTDTNPATNMSPFASLAIDAGNNCVQSATCGTNNPPVSLSFDQRGAYYFRLSGPKVDIGAYEFQQAPTAAGVTVSGRVLADGGRGLSNAEVTLTTANGVTRTVITTARGNFNFDDVEAGQTIVLRVVSKLYQFSPQIIALADNLSQINFIPQSSDKDISAKTNGTKASGRPDILTASPGEEK